MVRKTIFKLCYAPLRMLPPAQVFNRLRGRVVGLFLASCGRNLRIYDHVTISNPDRVSIGDNVVVNPGVFLVAARDATLHIGDDCLIAPRCFIETMNHRFDDPSVPIRLQGIDAQPIRLERDVWLGYGVVVLPGVTIGEGCVVGAYSLVNRSLEPFTVNVGNPVRTVRRRGEGS